MSATQDGEYMTAVAQLEDGVRLAPADPNIEIYGFQWGNTIVQRTAEIDGTKVLTIKAGSNHVTVYVSPTGRSIRVFDHKSREMKA